MIEFIWILVSLCFLSQGDYCCYRDKNNKHSAGCDHYYDI